MQCLAPLLEGLIHHYFNPMGMPSLLGGVPLIYKENTMTDRTLTKLKYMLLKMADEDPNHFLDHLYHSGMDQEDIHDLKYMIDIARRAKGYDESKDQLKLKQIF